MNINKNKVFTIGACALLSAVILAMVFPACKKVSLKDNVVVNGTRMMKLYENSKYASEDAFAEASYEPELEEVETDSSSGQSKKIIRNGNVTVEVPALNQAQTVIEEWVKKYGGYISNSSQGEKALHVTAHIPQDKFSQAIAECGDFGRLISRNMTSRDVSDDYYDLDTRLETKRVLLEKLKGYLKDAKNVDEIMKVENKIASVTSELESMQSRMNRLSKEIDYSQIDIYATLPANTNEDGFILPDMKNSFRKFAANLIEFFENYLWAVFYILIGGALCILLFIFLYWLCFGKLGLVKKLFNKIK